MEPAPTLQPLQRLGPVLRDLDGMALRLERALHKITGRLVVVGEKYFAMAQPSEAIMVQRRDWRRPCHSFTQRPTNGSSR